MLKQSSSCAVFELLTYRGVRSSRRSEVAITFFSRFKCCFFTGVAEFDRMCGWAGTCHKRSIYTVVAAYIAFEGGSSCWLAGWLAVSSLNLLCAAGRQQGRVRSGLQKLGPPQQQQQHEMMEEVYVQESQAPIRK
jgi:hypothetical protein